MEEFGKKLCESSENPVPIPPMTISSNIYDLLFLKSPEILMVL